MPPPPSDGFSNTGKPTRRAASAIASSDWSLGVSPGTTGTPASTAIAPCGDLRPHSLDGLSRWPDERQILRLVQADGEVGVLREEPVAGMHRLGAALSRSGKDRVNREIAVDRRRRANADGACRRASCATHARPRLNRPRPTRCPSRGTRGSRAPRSRRDWRSGFDRRDAVPVTGYIRKMPYFASGIGALYAAEIPSASACRVSTGSRMPSSQSRAVE